MLDLSNVYNLYKLIIFIEMYKVFIGYDSKEKIASDVCEYSIKKKSSNKVEINLLKLEELKGKKIYTRDNDKSRTVVVYPNGIARKSLNFGLFTFSPRVKKGSTIKVVDKKEKIKEQKESPVDWNKQIENAMLKITAVLTLWLLVDRVSAQ